MACVGSEPETNFQFANDPWRALSVLQMPPPAAACHKRQREALHAGSTTRAVIRPASTYGAPVNVSVPGSCAKLGPARVQVPGAARPPQPRLSVCSPDCCELAAPC